LKFENSEKSEHVQKNHIVNEFKNEIIFFRFPAKLRGFFRNRLKIDLS
jgi:hypothetical protein